MFFVVCLRMKLAPVVLFLGKNPKWLPRISVHSYDGQWPMLTSWSNFLSVFCNGLRYILPLSISLRGRGTDIITATSEVKHVISAIDECQLNIDTPAAKILPQNCYGYVRHWSAKWKLGSLFRTNRPTEKSSKLSRPTAYSVVVTSQPWRVEPTNITNDWIRTGLYCRFYRTVQKGTFRVDINCVCGVRACASKSVVMPPRGQLFKIQSVTWCPQNGPRCSWHCPPSSFPQDQA